MKGQPKAWEMSPPTQRMMKDPNAAPEEKREKKTLMTPEKWERVAPLDIIPSVGWQAGDDW